ncbi:hypothetical protein V8E51_013593 [Hyaloscypha variabilis]
MICMNILLASLISHFSWFATWDAPRTQITKRTFSNVSFTTQIYTAALLTSVCGYVADSGGPVTCLQSEYCGFQAFDSQNEIFGCCKTAAISVDSTYFLLGCEMSPTCYQTIQTPPLGDCSAGDWICCHSSCQSNPLALYCTEATSSACVEFQLSLPGGTYSAYACSNSNAAFDVLTTESYPPTAIIPAQTTTVSIFIPPTATQRTAVSVLLPLSTTKSGAAERVDPAWSVGLICGGLVLLL